MDGRIKAVEDQGKAVEDQRNGSGRSRKYRTPGGSGGDGGGGGPGGTGGGGGIPSFLNFGHEALVSSTTRKGTVIV